MGQLLDVLLWVTPPRFGRLNFSGIRCILWRLLETNYPCPKKGHCHIHSDRYRDAYSGITMLVLDFETDRHNRLLLWKALSSFPVACFVNRLSANSNQSGFMDYENDESMEAQHLEYTIICSSIFMRRCTDFQFKNVEGSSCTSLVGWHTNMVIHKTWT